MKPSIRDNTGYDSPSPIPWEKAGVRASLAFVSLLSIALVQFFLPLRTLAWGHEGHEVIAALAQTMLSNNVLAKVQSILQTNEMASVALWADQARQLMKYHTGPLTNSDEAKHFIAAHPDNADWHFLNLPLKTSGYDYNGRFATNTDIVHALTNCIAVLEGQPGSITTTQALRYIIHLAGDIHQPLHVACGYYVPKGNSAKLLKRPGAISNTEAHDAGANKLIWLTGQTTNNLHAYWDDHMVTTVDPSTGNSQMMIILQSAIAKNANLWKGRNDYHNWPARWAEDSAGEANGVYKGVTFQSAVFKANDVPKEITITLPNNYDAQQNQRVTRQLAKAGYHLAELLNQIRWAQP